MKKSKNQWLKIARASRRHGWKGEKMKNEEVAEYRIMPPPALMTMKVSWSL